MVRLWLGLRADLVKIFYEEWRIQGKQQGNIESIKKTTCRARPGTPTMGKKTTMSRTVEPIQPLYHRAGGVSWERNWEKRERIEERIILIFVYSFVNEQCLLLVSTIYYKKKKKKKNWLNFLFFNNFNKLIYQNS
jgi:hypothetical protein